MNSTIDLLLSPTGIVALVAVVAWFFLIETYPVLKWVGLGFALYAASLQKFYDPFKEMDWYPFYGPIETLVQNGRWVTMGCLAVLLLMSLMQKQTRRELIPPRMMWPIHTIQVLLLIKMLVGSVSLGFIVQAAVVYALVAALGIFGVRNWMGGEKSMKGPAAALTTAVGLFCLLVEWQLRIDPTAVILDNGRLIGTCANPQHAAVLLAACLPGPLYFLVSGRVTPLTVKILAAVLMVTIGHLLFLTGSRTGVAMALIILVIFFRRRIMLPVIALSAFYLAYTFLLDTDAKESSTRLVSLEDTRSDVWQAQWRAFLSNPIFGVPVRGDRLGFGENSWLALMASTGVIGAAVLGWLLVSILRESWSLFQKERKAGRALASVDFCLAGFAALFAGSFMEAYLLGVITLPILAILTYSVASERLLEARRGGKRRRQRAPRRRKQIDDRGPQNLTLEANPK